MKIGWLAKIGGAVCRVRVRDCVPWIAGMILAISSPLRLLAAEADSSAPTPPVAAPSKIPPKRVEVLPVFFVPQGQPPFTPTQVDILMRHVKWAQARYRELLHDEDTFAIAADAPKIFYSIHPLSFYHSLPAGTTPTQFASELLDDLHYNRYTCPYVFLVIVKNDDEPFPFGFAGPFNGGFDHGGGLVELCTHGIEHSAGFQNTLQHELGHAFGLVHPDAYGYSMQTNDSFMSYNPAFYTDNFKPSATPGKLIPEDLRALGMNKLVFPNFHFDPDHDVPPEYAMRAAVPFTPWDIPGQQAYDPVDEQRAHLVPLLLKDKQSDGKEQEGTEMSLMGSANVGKRLLGFSVALAHPVPDIQLQYMVNLSDGTDTPWLDAGTFAAEAQRVLNPAILAHQAETKTPVYIQGFAFRLIGEAHEKYDVWYQAGFEHLEFVGQAPHWYWDGELCGGQLQPQPLEQFSVAIVPKQ